MGETASYAGRLNLQEQVTRIDRAIAETQKFQRESKKLRAEELKFDRDRHLIPAAAMAAFIGAAMAAFGPAILRAITGHYP